MYKLLIDALFPPRCSICNSHITEVDEFESVCDSCFSSIQAKTGFSCSECQKRIPTLSSMCHKKNYLLMSACDFHDAKIQKLIYDYKYHSIRSLSVPLTRILLSTLTSILSELPFSLEDAFIIPIPLSKTRMRERGFNQSEDITNEIIKYIPELKSKNNILKRITSGPQQAKTHSAQERIIATKNTFVAERNDERSNIILVDDVFTTGATAEDAIRALKKVGYKRILVATIAKT